MLGLVDSFFDRQLAFLWEQTVPHHCLTCFSRKSNLSYRYINDIIYFNNKRFNEFISDIYPKELTISETTESTSVALISTYFLPEMRTATLPPNYMTNVMRLVSIL